MNARLPRGGPHAQGFKPEMMSLRGAAAAIAATVLVPILAVTTMVELRAARSAHDVPLAHPPGPSVAAPLTEPAPAPPVRVVLVPVEIGPALAEPAAAPQPESAPPSPDTDTVLLGVATDEPRAIAFDDRLAEEDPAFAAAPVAEAADAQGGPFVAPMPVPRPAAASRRRRPRAVTPPQPAPVQTRPPNLFEALFGQPRS